MGRRVLSQIVASRWAMTEEALRQLLAIAAREQSDPAAAAAARQAVEAVVGDPLAGTRTVTVRDGIATVPLVGPMMRYANFFTEISGATSSELFARDVMEAVTNPHIRAVLLAVNSPGGEVDGTQEAAELVFQARGTKPIWAHISGDGASAAYWVASAADRVVAGPTAVVGSIGVRAAFTDWSEWERKQGVRTIEIVSSQSPRKVPDPATDDGRAEIQALLDDLAEVFVGAVARNRGVHRETVLTQYGAGGVFVGVRALEAGLIDGLATHEEAHAALVDSLTTRRTFPMPGMTAPAADPAAQSETDPPAPASAPTDPPAPTPDDDAPADPPPPPADAAAIAAAAATAERERLAALDALMRPGAEAILARAKADPAITPAAAAHQIVLAENQRRTGLLRALQQDVTADPAPAAAPTSEGDGTPPAARSLLSTLHRMNSERAAARRTP